MPKYRKKPVVIEARQFTGAGDQASLAMWCHGVPTGDGNITIATIEGAMVARPGDYIVRGVKGEFYPCKPDIFDMTYEPVTERDMEEGGGE